jgi:hypothetical protein
VVELEQEEALATLMVEAALALRYAEPASAVQGGTVQEAVLQDEE